MPLPPVVIELNQSDAASPNTDALVAACTSAVSDGECRLGPSTDATARAVVMVTFSDGQRHAHIEIGVKSGKQSRWVNRDLDFRNADPERERWRSVGLVIGTLVGKTEKEVKAAESTAATAPPAPPENPNPAGEKPEEKPAAKPAEKPAAKPAPVAPPPAAGLAGAAAPLTPLAPRRPTRLWLGIEGASGPALDNGSWRFGAGLIGVYDFPSRWLLSAAARYSARPSSDSDVDERWFTGTAGVGLRGEPLPSLRLEGRAELLVELLEAEIVGRRHDYNSRWLIGGRLSLITGALLDNWAMLIAGGEVNVLGRGTVITVEGAQVARVPPITFSIVVGARFGVF